MPHNYAYTVLCIHHPWSLGRTHFIFRIFHYSYCGERDEGSRSVEWLNVPVSIMPLHKTSFFVAGLLSAVKRKRTVSRAVRFSGDVRVCVLGRVTEFRSSIIPDWHQLDSEVFTAAMPVSASDSWDRRICDVCSLGSSEKFILQLPSPLPVLLRSQQSLRPFKK